MARTSLTKPVAGNISIDTSPDLRTPDPHSTILEFRLVICAAERIADQLQFNQEVDNLVNVIERSQEYRSKKASTLRQHKKVCLAAKELDAFYRDSDDPNPPTLEDYAEFVARKSKGALVGNKKKSGSRLYSTKMIRKILAEGKRAKW